MLNEIGDVEKVNEYVAKAKDKVDPFKLMGFGHRVYKISTQSAGHEESCHAVLAEQGVEDEPLLGATTLENGS